MKLSGQETPQQFRGDFIHCVALQFPTVFDNHRLARRSARRPYRFNSLNHVHTFHDFAEDDVLAIEVRCLPSANEELRAVGVGSRVRHRQAARTSVLASFAFEAFVSELLAVDRLATGSVAIGEISALAHET